MDINKTLLLILDGWGYSDSSAGNAIKAANLPNYDKLLDENPNILINASGTHVGLPEGIMGNSEVGHENIGAGRVNKQKLTLISDQTETGEFFENKTLAKAFEHVKKNNSKIHFIGLISEGDVHSHLGHLNSLIDFAKRSKIANNDVVLHAISDGRDDPPYVAADLMKIYDENPDLTLASVCGRYWAMDRDNNWDRIDRFFNIITKKDETEFIASSGVEAIEQYYDYAKNNNVIGDTDEFVLPTVVKKHALINENDAVIFFNFRPDRAIEISSRFKDLKKEWQNLSYTCFTSYDSELELPVAFGDDSLLEQDFSNSLGQVLADKGLNQFRLAETEKFRHVTMFFNQRQKNPFENEDRELIASPKVATYDLQPEMSAEGVCQALVKAMANKEKDYKMIVCNFANPDMVGHTGNIQATIKAVEFLDKKLIEIVKVAKEQNYTILLTADHGNADQMLDDKGGVRTAHSVNKVPLVLINSKFKLQGSETNQDTDYALANIAPTILELMGLEIPKEMTEKSMLFKQEAAV